MSSQSSSVPAVSGPVPIHPNKAAAAQVARSRSRKGTLSKIGKLFGVSRNVSGDDPASVATTVAASKPSVLTNMVSNNDQQNGKAVAPPSPPSSSSSSSRSVPTSGRSSPRLSSVASGANNLPPAMERLSASSSALNLSSMNEKNCSGRFIVHEDGTHEHHLKNAKRQEKLGSMIKNMLGAQKLRGEAKSAVPDILIKSMKSGDPPSLFSGLISQVNADNNHNGTAPAGAYPYSGATQVVGSKPDSKMINFEDAVNPLHQSSITFGQKYGRCQEVIGKGSFGVVRICHKKNLHSHSGEILYAVKEFRRKPTEDPVKYSKRLTSEFCISSSLKHTNIINTLDLFQDAKGDYCEVMEYCSGGDLFTLIIAAGKLEYQEADCFFKQLITGVVYMHNMGVCHRDLKPENLLLTHDGVLKITDFGNSECFRMAWEKEIHLSGGVCGSSPYIAPEEYTQDEFDPRPVDIWACGVIYMAMRTGRQLWASAQKDDEFYLRYIKGRKNASGYDPIEKLKRARCRNVIYSILDPVPNRRLSGDQVLNSEWGREIYCCHEGHSLK